MPLGVSAAIEGLNFSLLSRHATSVRLVILPEQDTDNTPIVELELDAKINRTGDHWHMKVQELPDTFRYGWKVDGPKGPTHRFDPSAILIDPAATLISSGAYWGNVCEFVPGRTHRRSLWTKRPYYQWSSLAPPRIPIEDTIVYELHVRGFTCHPSSGASAPGTFRALAEKIPYLKDLGVTAVELLPIHEFDENECRFVDPTTGETNHNFWGYNTIAFSAPKAAYAATGNEHGQLDEFRDMVAAFHRAGMEVWLDVVFNHTGEGGNDGRTYSFRGIDNSLYYMMSPEGEYLNFTGCGNTVSCNHPVVRNLIINSLHFWVGEMHVDGLRFDLASIFGRDMTGKVVDYPPILEILSEDGVLRDTKLVAEPWDAAGLYQVGKFPYGKRWSEWNGKYRDDIRSFWKGEIEHIGPLATRLCGSADLYEWNYRNPSHSINFVTCHDGFTMNDMVSYNRKHNLANGENNRDGMDDNTSWNCGTEGPTADAKILSLRARQARNLMATLLLSQGVPMILGGDEFLRTQKGNNNAWCQDNDISWVDWTLIDTNADYFRFVRLLIHFRRNHPVLRRGRFFRGKLPDPSSGGDGPKALLPAALAQSDLSHLSDIHWHGLKPFKPVFECRTLVIALDGRFHGRDLPADCDLCLIVHGEDFAAELTIPPSPSRRAWRDLMDTARTSPDDFRDEETAPDIEVGSVVTLAPHSFRLLVSRAN